MAVFTNQASLSYGGNTVNSNIVTGEIVDILTATKTAVSGIYNGDDAVTYIVSLTNTGTTALSGLTVTDNLGAYSFGESTLTPLDYVDGTVIYYVNGVLQPTPTAVSGDSLSVTGISVPAGGNAILVYQATTNQFAPLSVGDTITNTVAITGGGLANAVTAEETVISAEEARLSISKSLSPTTVTENGQITYTFVIENRGNTAVTATDSAVITDTFDPVLENISVTFNGDVWALGTNYTYDSTTGVFSTTPGPITVPAATYTQDPTTGAYTISPGVSILTVTGTV